MADGGRPLRVLCLEDSPSDAELMSEALTRGGYELDLDLAEDRAAFERQPFERGAILGQVQVELVAAARQCLTHQLGVGRRILQAEDAQWPAAVRHATSPRSADARSCAPRTRRGARPPR